MARSSRPRNVARFLGGLVLGLVLSAIVLWMWLQSAPEGRLERALLERVDLPRGAFDLEEVTEEGALRIAARNVVLFGEGGDTIASVPLMRFVMDLSAFSGDGPIEFDDVLLRDPYLNLVQLPGGEWNLSQVTRVEANGEEVEMDPEDGGRAFVFRDVRIEGGRARLVTPWDPDGTLAAGEDAPVRLVRSGGRAMRVRTVRDLDARLPLLRFGGERGWRVVVAEASARLTDPDVRVVRLAGSAESTGADGVRFALDVLRTENSVLDGEGTVRFAGDDPRYDVTIRASPLAFQDLRWLVPALPEEGRAEGVVALRSREGGRVAVEARDLTVTALDSRVTGNLSALVGGDAPPVFYDTRLVLDPLTLSTIERLGLVEEPLPYEGEIRGVVATTGEATGLQEGALRVDLLATVTPKEGGAPASTLAMTGPVAFGEEGAPIRFLGTQVSLRPLHLAALRPVVEGQERWLSGILRGEASLTGTLQDLRIAEGDLTYEVGTAPPIRLVDISADVTREPALRYDVRATASPLALATLTELFPALPFRSATLTGPIRVQGSTERIRVAADLSGDAGAISVNGEVIPGDPLRFDLSGRVEAFRAAAVFAAELPMEGPLSGTYALAGTTEDLRFDVDLAQGEGRFALEGRLRRPGGSAAQVDVAGQVTNFRLGMLLGRPGLLPSPVTGAIRFTGGGRQAYTFDVDLAGELGGIDLEGWYQSGDVPSYAASGSVRGIDLRRFPGLEALPATELTASIDLQGRGTTPGTLEGRLAFDAARGSTIAGLALDDLRGRMAVRGGILRVDTLVAAMGDARLSAAGSWGLERPAAEPLRFSLVARDLSRIAPVVGRIRGIEPLMTGSLTASGALSGSLDRPVLSLTAQGRNLRYESWRAGRLALEANVSWRDGIPTMEGEVELVGQDLQLAGNMTLETLRLEAVGDGDDVGIAMLARRDADTELTVSARLDIDDRALTGAAVESLALRTGDTAWRLADRTRIRWGGVDGIAIDNLVLQQEDGPGLIAMDGRIPPTGTADLRMSLTSVDLGLIQGLVPRAPDLAGVVTLEAVAEGPVGDPEVVIQGRVDSLRYEGAEADRVLLYARYADGMLAVDSISAWSGEYRLVEGNLQVPMRLAFEGAIPRVELLRDQPLRGVLAADSLPVALLTASLPQVEDGRGALAGEVRIGGTVEDPTLQGWMDVRNGAVTVNALAVRYEDIRGRLSFDGNVATVDSLTVRAGEGTASVGGTVRIGADRPLVYLTASFDSFLLSDNEEYNDLVGSGRVVLSGRIPSPVLTGAVRLESGTIEIPDAEEAELELLDAEIGELAGEESAAPPSAFPAPIAEMRVDALRVALGGGVWIENQTLRAQLESPEVLVSRTADGTFWLTGDVNVVRGTYRLEVGPIVREFDVVSGSVSFVGTREFNPSVDILASYRVLTTGTGPAPTAAEVLVRLTGTLESPNIELTTNTQPPLPTSEVLSLLVFGRPSYQLSAEGLGALPSQLLVGEVFGAYAAEQGAALLRDLGLGFDYVRVRGRPELGPGLGLQGEAGFGALGSLFGTTTIEFAEQFGNDWYLSLEVPAGLVLGQVQLPGVSVTKELTPAWSWSAAYEPVLHGYWGPRIGADYQFSTEFRGHWEFGHPEEVPPVAPGTRTDTPPVTPPDETPPELTPRTAPTTDEGSPR